MLFIVLLTGALWLGGAPRPPTEVGVEDIVAVDALWRNCWSWLGAYDYTQCTYYIHNGGYATLVDPLPENVHRLHWWVVDLTFALPAFGVALLLYHWVVSRFIRRLTIRGPTNGASATSSSTAALVAEACRPGWRIAAKGAGVSAALFCVAVAATDWNAQSLQRLCFWTTPQTERTWTDRGIRELAAALGLYYRRANDLLFPRSDYPPGELGDAQRAAAIRNMGFDEDDTQYGPYTPIGFEDIHYGLAGGLRLLPALFVALLLYHRIVYPYAAPHGYPRCQGCGYNLTGLTTDRCPECGVPVLLGPEKGNRGSGGFQRRAR